ncbi:unnamed protein product [Amaranthus hypochondriacus]
MVDSILTNLVLQLGSLAVDEYNFLKGVGDQLKSLENELRFMKKFLRNSEGKQHEHQLVRELVDQIREVAFEAEDVIETFLLNFEKQKLRSTFKKMIHSPQHALMLREVAKQIDGIKTRINEIYDNKEKYGIELGDGSMNPYFQASLERRRREVDDEMVGFVDVADSLLKRLTEGSTGLEIISIVGMGGLGKTTITKKLYNDRIIKDHFKSHAWVSVSEDYNTRQVLLDALKRVVPNMEGVDNMDTNGLKDMLRGRLQDRKFIVFLDDVWQPDMWDEIKTCFPSARTGSRIVITTRIANVARHASHNDPHFLRFLTPSESWQLFEKKVFGGDPCPPNLKSSGNEIVKACKQLPLSIVVIASMLASQEKSERIWARTLKDVSVHLGKDDACLEILALSYHNLPIELKPCFLYFSAFPEDYEMSVRTLISLWIAEGFISPLGKLTLEEVAESYLDALIDRSLVQAGTRRTDGGFKTCRIHDLIRDLCIRESQCENFMWAASKLNHTSSTTTQKKPRRVSVHHKTTRAILSDDWDPSSIRALLSFEEGQKFMASSAFLKKLYTRYKLLRVLDLGSSVIIEKLPSEIENLINLRYLKIVSSFPDSIFNLRNLEMLLIESPTSLSIPISSLLKLQNLKQLVTGKSCFSRLYGNSTKLLPNKQLKNLQILSSVFPDSDFESAVVNGLCPNLRKLSVWGSAGHCWSLQNFIAYLPDLQTLKIYNSKHSYSSKNDILFKGVGVRNTSLPSSLTKITLKSSYCLQEWFDTLSRFPNLCILKLADLYLPDLIVKDGSFPRLHTLHLDNFKDVTVTLDDAYVGKEESAFPQLRHLVVHKCNAVNIKVLFLVPSLKDIEVLWPDDYLANELDELRQSDKIKCRLLVYRGG